MSLVKGNVMARKKPVDGDGVYRFQTGPWHSYML